MREIISLLRRLRCAVGERCYVSVFGDGSWTLGSTIGGGLTGNSCSSDDPTADILAKLAKRLPSKKAEAMAAFDDVAQCVPPPLSDKLVVVRRYLEAQPDDTQGEPK